MSEPTLVTLSLGAGVQSTTLALMACEGVLPKPDVAIFADTGWEPASVYAHLDRLGEALEAAGIPLRKVSYGNLRDDTLDPSYGGIRIPVFLDTDGPGVGGVTWRQCTDLYKVAPIMQTLRVMLGGAVSEHPCRKCDSTGRRVTPWSIKAGQPQEADCSACRGTGTVRRVGAPPAGALCHQWIGFSTDEVGRVSDSRVRYVKHLHPLLDLNMSRKDCQRWLSARGWGTTPKSACIGCPFHGNRMWRQLRDEHPAEWADAVKFDYELREAAPASGVRGVPYLHGSRLPLDQAPIDRVTRREWDDRQVDLLDLIAEDGDPDGCSPYGCRSGEPAA